MADLTFLPHFCSLSSLFFRPRQSKSKKANDSYGLWHELPADIILKIMQRLDFIDHIALSMVCKSWRSVARSFPYDSQLLFHQPPWLLLPHENSNHELRFFDMSSGREYKFNLPKPMKGGWCCGCSKGWIVIAKGSKFNPRLFLFNPISGFSIELPSIRTVALYDDNIHDMSEDESYDFSLFIIIELSSADLSTCIVAALYGDQCNDNSVIAVCRPDDDDWFTFPKEGDYYDVLFSNGVLCVLDGKVELEETYTLTLYDDEEQEVELMFKMIPTPKPDPDGVLELDPLTETFCVVKDFVWSWNLLQTNDGLLIVERIKDEFEGVFEIDDVELEDEDLIPNIVDEEDEFQSVMDDEEEEDEFQSLMEEEEDEDPNIEEDDFVPNLEEEDEEEEDEFQSLMEEEEDEDPNIEEDDFVPNLEEEDEEEEEDDYGYYRYQRTSGFNVYKLDRSHSGELCATKLDSLGDQMLFAAANGMLAKEIKGWRGNCIYFDDNTYCKSQGFEPQVSRERGVFYLDDGTIKRPFPSIKRRHLTRFCTSWFTPIPW
ncbi:hypothetical protein HS088_TW22G00677 [Tripterygium wilfordii]|uniref:F-box domain-containing protein n=1 Tax=Tripterygium wilfordii TaxID=458696 RepID=A0A7J7BYQ0_TRIWF|nr:hypothetical protein HS088_TW22G00677 [Tripterygium wilfordii]